MVHGVKHDLGRARFVQCFAIKQAVQQHDVEGDGFVNRTESKSLFLHHYRDDCDF